MVAVGLSAAASFASCVLVISILGGSASTEGHGANRLTDRLRAFTRPPRGCVHGSVPLYTCKEARRRLYRQHNNRDNQQYIVRKYSQNSKPTPGDKPKRGRHRWTVHSSPPYNWSCRLKSSMTSSGTVCHPNLQAVLVFANGRTVGDLAYADSWLKEEKAGYITPLNTADKGAVYDRILNEFYDEVQELSKTAASEGQTDRIIHLISTESHDPASSQESF